MIRDHEVGVGGVSASTFRKHVARTGQCRPMQRSPPTAAPAQSDALGSNGSSARSPVSSCRSSCEAPRMLIRILIRPEQPAHRAPQETEAGARLRRHRKSHGLSAGHIARRARAPPRRRERRSRAAAAAAPSSRWRRRRACQTRVQGSEGRALPDSGAGLGEEMVVAIEGVGNGLGERLLLGSRLEVGEHRFETTAGTEVLAHAPEAR